MALSDLFGFPLGRRRKENSDSEIGGNSRLKSVVAPNFDEGTASVEIAPSGFYASTLDLDCQIRDDNTQITQYRSMVNHGEIESTVDDIINEAIVTEEGTPTVRLILDDIEMSEKVKDAIRQEFEKILRMLDFNNRGYEIFRKWYVDGRIYYHMIIDPDQQSKGIQELRFVDPITIRKVQEIKKEKQPGTNIDLIGDVQEYFLFTPETKPGGDRSGS